MHAPRYSKTGVLWQAWGAIATTIAVVIAAVAFLFTFINANRVEIQNTRTAIDSAIQDLRVEIRGNRLDLDNDLEIIDARLEQRMNSIDSIFTQNMLHLNGTIERAAAQAHVHTTGPSVAPEPVETK